MTEQQPDDNGNIIVSPTTAEAPVAVSQDAKNMALLNWLGTIFFGFIPGLLFYLLQKTDGYVQEQSKESLNWSITMMLAYFVAFLLSFILIGLLLIPVIGLTHVIVCILGIIATSQGKHFKTPFGIRLIK